MMMMMVLGGVYGKESKDCDDGGVGGMAGLTCSVSEGAGDDGDSAAAADEVGEAGGELGRTIGSAADMAGFRGGRVCFGICAATAKAPISSTRLRGCLYAIRICL